MAAGLSPQTLEINAGSVPNNGNQDVFTQPTILKNGDFVVTWLRNTGDVYQRLYNADGTAKGVAEEVTTSTSGFAGASGVVSLKGGGYAIYWREAGSGGSTANIRFYGEDGVATGPARSVSGGEASLTEITGTTLKNGNVLISWGEFLTTGSIQSKGRIVKQSGNFAGGEKDLNAGAGFQQKDMDTAGLTNGKFAQVWAEYSGSPTNRDDLKVQLYTKAGAASGGTVTVNATIEGDQFDPKVTALKGGGFVVTWWGSFGIDGNSWGVFGQVFNGNGGKVGSEFQLNTTTDSQQWAPDIVDLPDGGFFAAWQSFDQDDSGEGIVGQRFDGTGGKVGDEFLINTSTPAAQWYAGIDSTAKGEVVVTWQSHHLGSNFWQVMAQSYKTPVLGTSGADTMRDTHGLNLMDGLGGRDKMFGQTGNDLMFGGGGNDRMSGDKGNDTLFGGKGSDTLTGGLGKDKLKGGAGPDTFAFDGSINEGRDTIVDFEDGVDVIRVKGSSFAATDVDPAGASNALVTLEGGTVILIKGIAPTDLTAADFDFV